MVYVQRLNICQINSIKHHLPALTLSHVSASVHVGSSSTSGPPNIHEHVIGVQVRLSALFYCKTLKQHKYVTSEAECTVEI